MPRKLASADPSSSTPPPIICTSQQTRFHAETLDASSEIDLKDVTISIGEKELVSGAHLRLKDGVKYALIGRNGSGKSTLMKAVADKLIPGLPNRLRILLLSQIEDSSRGGSNEEGTVLEHVLEGDRRRLDLLEKQKALTDIIESPLPIEAQKIMDSLNLSEKRYELAEAQKLAIRRSGARGKEARTAEIRAEQELKEAEEAMSKMSLDDVDSDLVTKATDMLAEVEIELNLISAASAEGRAVQILTGLGFSQDMREGKYAALSGGWRSRCALAIALLVHNDCLLLDEPSNYLDLEAILWLESFLSSLSSTLLITSHDQAFLDNVVSETVELRHRELKLEYFEGTPTAMKVERRKENKRARGVKDALDKKKEHIEKSIAQSKAAAKKSGDDNRARMAKSRQKKLDERWGVETSAKGGRFKLNRDLAGYHLTARADQTVEVVDVMPKVVVPSPEPLRTKEDLVHFEDVAFWHPGAKKVVFSDVSFTVTQSGRAVFLGANGQGKTTLARMIMGEIAPKRGKIVRHPLLRIGYYSQHSVEELARAGADPTVTALSHFLRHFEEAGDKVDEQEARACLGTWGLKGRIASDTSLSALSGGQKVRLAFALSTFRPPPLLLLDEPTTHLDSLTIESLARALQSFTGAIVLITHDRWFSRVVVEGTSFSALRREQFDEDPSDDSSSSDDNDTDETKPPGLTYHVGGGRVRRLEGGMLEYVKKVEKKLAKNGLL